MTSPAPAHTERMRRAVDLCPQTTCHAFCIWQMRGDSKEPPTLLWILWATFCCARPPPAHHERHGGLCYCSHMVQIYSNNYQIQTGREKLPKISMHCTSMCHGLCGQHRDKDIAARRTDSTVPYHRNAEDGRESRCSSPTMQRRSTNSNVVIMTFDSKQTHHF